jgi:hypothetical protein
MFDFTVAEIVMTFGWLAQLLRTGEGCARNVLEEMPAS